MKQSHLYQICQYFKGRPVEYAEQILGIQLSTDQRKILESLVVSPYRTLVRSCNNAGKSFIAAVAALYAYDCYEQSIVIVTAPVFKQISSIIFKEIRTLGRGREGFSPKAPLLFDNPKHQIMGNTASDSTAFQGIHDCNVFVIADELVGIEPTFIEAIEPMLNGIEAWFFLGLYNPTDQASSAFQMELTGKYTVMELNALMHDNIRAESQGIPAPFPNAVRLSRLREMIEMWCDEVSEKGELTFEFEGKIWMPSPVAEARILGRWPALAANAVWTHHIFNICCNKEFPLEDGKLQIGVDVAAFGDDNSVIAVRKGKSLIYVESHNGWSPLQLAARIKEVCNEYHQKYNLKIIERIPVAIDDGGVGAALRDMGVGYNFIPVNFSSSAKRQDLYRIKRDEIHFIIADAARKGMVSFSRIPQWQQNELRTELLAPTYTLDFMGRRVVEKKTKTKELIGRSPDMGDAVMLAFMDIHGDMFEMKPPKMPEYKKKTLNPYFRDVKK